jgi:cell division protein FtsW
MTSFARTDTSLISRWWWTVDRWTIVSIFLLACAGIVLTMAASPAVAERIGVDPFHFARRQAVYLPIALIVMLATSLLSPVGVRRLAVLGLVVSFALTVLTLFAGIEIKGATRWLHLGPISLQPSEFLKPAFAVVCALIIARSRGRDAFIGYPLSLLLLGLVAAVLLRQPDVGTTVLLVGTWGMQIVLGG